MAGKNTAVFGIYRDRPQVSHAVDTLINQGFRSADISVMLPNNVGTKDFAHEKGTKAPDLALRPHPDPARLRHLLEVPFGPVFFERHISRRCNRQ